MFKTVIIPEDCHARQFNRSHGKVCILTDRLEFIKEVVHAPLSNEIIPVRVVESNDGIEILFNGHIFDSSDDDDDDDDDSIRIADGATGDECDKDSGADSDSNYDNNNRPNNSKNSNKNSKLEETMSEEISNITVKSLWGNPFFDFATKPSNGKSGGILAIWDKRKFTPISSSIGDGFLAVLGWWRFHAFL
ncbi:hypothetical protein Tco_0053865 [Tanacetum coccineum]